MDESAMPGCPARSSTALQELIAGGIEVVASLSEVDGRRAGGSTAFGCYVR